MPRPLIVAATAAEAAHVPDGVEVLVTGVGKTAAATALTRHLMTCADLRDVELVNLGTAGALRDDVDGLFEVGTVINHDISAEALRAFGYDPRERLVVGRGDTVLASGDVFVSDPAVRARLASQAQLVDMEGYAVAYVAAELGVPLRMVKHVSDNADEGALDWLQLVDRSARVLGDWAAENL